jgi:hypothetical protein
LGSMHSSNVKGCHVDELPSQLFRKQAHLVLLLKFACDIVS